MAGELPLGQLVELVQPGTYTITADLSWNDQVARSAPVVFTIGNSVIRACHVLARPGLANSAGFSAFCLRQKTSEVVEIVRARFNVAGQFGPFERSGVDAFASVGPEAQTVVGPWMTSDDIGAPARRACYQAGAQLGVVGFEGKGAMSLTLPFVPRIVRPALGVASGELDLFVVDDEGKRLGLVRFPKAGDEGDHKLLWTTALASDLTSARAALSAPGGGDRRHALLVADGPGGTVLVLAEAGDGTGAPKLHTAAVHDLHARASSEPGLQVEAGGRVRAAVVLETPARADGSVEVSLVEVVWEPDRGTPHVESSVLATLPAAPRAAAATYSVSRGAVRHAWAILTADGAVRSSGTPDGRATAGIPLLPLELLPTRDLTAVLTVDANGAPALEQL